MNAKTSIEGANSLTKNALDHCIFPITHRDDIQKYGPMIMASGSGVQVVDIHGKTYLDMMGSSSRANSLGYGNEEIARAMYEQAKTLHYIGSGRNVTEPMIKLATRIAELAPGRLSKVMFVSGGSEAVETAFKIAKQYHQASGKKPSAYKIISRWNAFHGATMGALSATDWLPVRETIDPRVPGYSFVGNPLSYRNPLGMSVEDYEEFCANHLERQIQLENPELVAAFIGEPIMQANGAQVPSKNYWRRVREICTKYDVLMIVDEIITGFGRAGHWFVSEHFDIEPDIMTSAKALTAGYMPMGAVITRDEIADAMPIFRHIHTFSGHAVAAAAGNAVIDIKTREKLIPKSLENGKYLQAGLKAAIGDHPMVGQIRGMGSWHAVDFTSNRETKAAFEDDTVRRIARRMLDLGVIVSPIGTSIEVAPALIVTHDNLDRTVDTFRKAIDEVASVSAR